jgi:hypothetical protein
MPRQHDNLFDRIASFQTLYAAAKRAVKDKRKKPGAAAFFANLEGELLPLERQLDLSTGPLRRVSDPKSASFQRLRFMTASCIMCSAR